MALFSRRCLRRDGVFEVAIFSKVLHVQEKMIRNLMKSKNYLLNRFSGFVQNGSRLVTILVGVIVFGLANFPIAAFAKKEQPKQSAAKVSASRNLELSDKDKTFIGKVIIIIGIVSDIKKTVFAIAEWLMNLEI